MRAMARMHRITLTVGFNVDATALDFFSSLGCLERFSWGSLLLGRRFGEVDAGFLLLDFDLDRERVSRVVGAMPRLWVKRNLGFRREVSCVFGEVLSTRRLFRFAS